MAATRREFLKGAAGATLLASVPRSAAAATSPSLRTATIAFLTQGGLGAEIMAQATAAAQIQVAAWPAGDETSAVYTPWASTPTMAPAAVSNAVKFQLPSLDLHGHSWQYQATCCPLGVDPQTNQSLWTTSAPRSPPVIPAVGASARFAFGFSSCQQITPTTDPLLYPGEVRPAETIARLAGRDLLTFSHIGDMGYPPSNSSDPTYRDFSMQFRNFYSHPQIAPVVASTLSEHDQDDHDLGRDDLYSDPNDPSAPPGYGAWYQGHPAPRQAFADLTPGCRRFPAPAYRRWQIADTEFFLLDCRTYSDQRRVTDPTQCQNGKYRSNLGQIQREWLYRGMRASTATVKVILSPRYFYSDYSAINLDGSPGGGERGEILSFLQTLPGSVLICSGDRHAAAHVYYGPLGAPNVTEMLCGPAHADVHHPIVSGRGVLWRQGRTDAITKAGTNLAGYVGIDALASHTATLHWVQADGADFHTASIPLRQVP